MAEASPQRPGPRVAFMAGAVAVLAVVLIALAWMRAGHATEGMKLGLREAPSLPSLPRNPEGPKLPNPPIPTPK